MVITFHAHTYGGSTWWPVVLAHNRNASSQGMTLIEMVIALAIIAVLATVTIPSYENFTDKARLKGAAENLAANLALARTEAIKRNMILSVSFTATGNSTWCFGIDENTGCNCHLVDPTNANACALPVAGAQALMATTTDTSVTPNASDNYRNIQMDAPSFGAGNAFTTIDPIRGMADSGSVTLTSAKGRVLKVILNLLGHARICTPATSTQTVPGYSTDSC